MKFRCDFLKRNFKLEILESKLFEPLKFEHIWKNLRQFIDFIWIIKSNATVRWLTFPTIPLDNKGQLLEIFEFFEGDIQFFQARRITEAEKRSEELMLEIY